jgi:sRNA-binding carbon storage regulator CsrA
MVVVVQRVGQRLFIGKHVVVTVLSIQGNYIELCVEGRELTLGV